MNLKYNSRLLVLPAFVTLALTCLGAQAQADIVVLQQHNYIEANLGYLQSDSSDSLTSWSGRVSLRAQGMFARSARASLRSTIAAHSLKLNSSTAASAKPVDLPPAPSFAIATTQLQFTVSATRTYHLAGTLKGDAFTPPAIQLFRDGIVVLSGPFSGAFLFEVGHTYEIDASARAEVFGIGALNSGYRFSMN